MQSKCLGAVFPLFVIALMAAERLAAVLLGSDPGNPALWAVSLELRSIFRMSSLWLAGLSGHSMIVQLALLIVAGTAVVATMSARTWPTISFLLNNGALALLVVAALVSSGSIIASSGEVSLMSLQLPASWPEVTSLHWCVLGVGLLGCVSSHMLLLTRYSASRRAVVKEIRALAATVLDNSPAPRNAPSRSR
jgi:hypothetical protein